MKKLAIIAMALTMALAVTACSNNTDDNSSTPENSSSQVQQESSVPEEEPSSSEEESEPVGGDLDENISQPPTGAEDEPEPTVDPDKVIPEE